MTSQKQIIRRIAQSLCTGLLFLSYIAGMSFHSTVSEAVPISFPTGPAFYYTPGLAQIDSYRVTSNNSEGKWSNERNGQFYFAGTSLLPTPISYSKYSSPNVFCAISFITKFQELINPAVLLNVSKLYFRIFIHRILPITSKYLHCPFQI